jgi:hypothetical protein
VTEESEEIAPITLMAAQPGLILLLYSLDKGQLHIEREQVIFWHVSETALDTPKYFTVTPYGQRGHTGAVLYPDGTVIDTTDELARRPGLVGSAKLGKTRWDSEREWADYVFHRMVREAGKRPPRY